MQISSQSLAILIFILLLLLGIAGAAVGVYRLLFLDLIPRAKYHYATPECPPEGPYRSTCPPIPDNWSRVDSTAGFSLKYPAAAKLLEVDKPYPGKIRLVSPQGQEMVETFSLQPDPADLPFEQAVCNHITGLGSSYSFPNAKSITRIVTRGGTEGIFVTRHPRPYRGGVPGVKAFSGPYYQHAYFRAKDGGIVELRAKIASGPYTSARVFEKVACSFRYHD